MDEAKCQVEGVARAKANADKLARQLEQQVADLSAKWNEASGLVTELRSQNKRMANELNSLNGQLQESEALVAESSASKLQLSAALDEARQLADEERRARNHVNSQVRLLNEELNEAKFRLEEEAGQREEAQKTANRLGGECQAWKTKYEAETQMR